MHYKHGFPSTLNTTASPPKNGIVIDIYEKVDVPGNGIPRSARLSPYPLTGQ